MPEDESSSVGQILRRRRQRLKLSLRDVELATKIRGKFLTSLESGRYDELPNDIYSRGFVQHYASYLGLNGPNLARQYAKDRGGLSRAATKAPELERPRSMVVTVRLAVVAVIVLAVVILVLYLSYQLSALAAAPRMTLSTPANNQVVSRSTVAVKGSVTPGSDLTVDNVPISSDVNGNFSTTVVLQDGVNTLRVVASSKLGKSTTIVRSILARLPQVVPSTATVPAATFAGVAIAVRVSGSATSIVVAVDGKQQFSGIFLPGEQMLFQGTSDIKLTTSNAGNTSVVVTNQTVASKSLKSLGKNGQVIQNQDFGIATAFP